MNAMVPLRILHVTPMFERAWAYGGIPRVVAALAHGQARRGHHVTVLATDVCDADTRLPAPGKRPLGAWPAQRSDDVNVQVFSNLSNALAYHLQFFVPLGLDGYLRQNAAAYDVAHLHGCHNLLGAIAGKHLRRAGVPYLVQTHGTAPRIERRVLAKWLFDHTVGRRTLPDATRLLAVSDAEQSQLLGLGIPAPIIRVIPPPVDVQAPMLPHGRFRKRFGVPWEKVVMYLGKLTPRKGLETLVDAFASLGRHHPVGLVIAGNDMGGGLAVQRLVDASHLRERVMFTGLLRGDERLDALADATVVAYPSRHEVFGLVPIEALLCGTPVVVADDSGCGEVITRTGGGRVVAEGDSRALAEAIDGMLSDPTRWRSDVLAAQRRVRDLCDPDAVLTRLDEVYLEMRDERLRAS